MVGRASFPSAAWRDRGRPRLSPSWWQFGCPPGQASVPVGPLSAVPLITGELSWSHHGHADRGRAGRLTSRAPRPAHVWDAGGRAALPSPRGGGQRAFFSRWVTSCSCRVRRAAANLSRCDSAPAGDGASDADQACPATSRATVRSARRDRLVARGGPFRLTLSPRRSPTCRPVSNRCGDAGAYRVRQPVVPVSYEVGNPAFGGSIPSGFTRTRRKTSAPPLVPGSPCTRCPCDPRDGRGGRCDPFLGRVFWGSTPAGRRSPRRGRGHPARLPW